MTKTATQICELALRRLRIVSRDESMQDDDADHALSALNLMLHGFYAQGINYDHTTLGASEQVGIPDWLHDGLVHRLAVRLAPDFGVPPPTWDGRDNDDWWRAFMDYFFEPEPAEFDLTLSRIPSRGHS